MNRPVMERSQSYSEAIRNTYMGPNLEETNLKDTEVYANQTTALSISELNIGNSENLVDKPRQPINVATSGLNTSHEILSEDLYQDCLQYLTQSENSDEDIVSGEIVMKIDVHNADVSPSPSNKLSRFPNNNEMASTSAEGRASTDNGNNGNDNVNEIEIFEDDSFMNNTTSITIPENTRSDTASFPINYSASRRTVHSRRHVGSRMKRSRRVVYKDGEENVPSRRNMTGKSIQYMRDYVNTLINSRWRYIVFIFIFSHLIFWLIFALIWLMISQDYLHDSDDNKEHCVVGTSSFAGMYMLAAETQMTIGYGVRYPSEECPEAILVMVVEIVVGTAISGLLVGLLFAKLVRPHKHLESVGFSKKAVVALRDGELCLLFRLWDLKRNHIISTNITAYMMKPIRTIEGEHHRNYIHSLKLKDDKAFLIWPLTVVHIINVNSPLFNMSAKDLIDHKFEIVVCLTGSSDNLGAVTQSRTSYINKEIMWGYRFKNVVNYSKKKEAYIVDIENLETVEQVDTPLCSASHLRNVCEDIQNDFQMEGISPPLSPTGYDSETPQATFEDTLCDGPEDTSPTVSAPATPRNLKVGWSFRRNFISN